MKRYRKARGWFSASPTTVQMVGCALLGAGWVSCRYAFRTRQTGLAFAVEVALPFVGLALVLIPEVVRLWLRRA